MPALQVVDLTSNKSEPTQVEQFFSKLGKNYKDKKDQVEIGKLIGEYQQNRQDVNAWEDLQLNLEKSDISPTKRLETQKSLNEMRKNVLEKDKTLNARVKAYEDEKKEKDKAIKEQKESEAILLNADYEPEEAARLSKDLSPASARSLVSNKPGAEFAKIREKSVSDYANNAIEQGEAAQEQKYTLAVSKKAVAGDVQGPGWRSVVKNSEYGQLMTGLTVDEAALQGSNKKLLEGSKGIFGAKPTEREIFLLLNSMLPSIGKTKEANMASIEFIERLNDLKIMRAEIVDKLVYGEPGGKPMYIPDLERQVNAMMKPMIDKYHEDLKVAEAKYGDNATEEGGKQGPKTIKVKAPDGSLWNMTQEQIDNAKETKGVIFEPVK